MSWTRGPSSRRKLKVNWARATSPSRSSGKRGGGTVAARARILSATDALKHIAGDDGRPLLVLRECKDCKGTDHALFEKGMHNEKTRLLVRYFHCVKLGTEVLRPDHPLRRLFETRGRQIPHVFVTAVDGQKRTNFSGIQTQSELRQALTRAINYSYARRPDLPKVLGSLSRLDALDSRIRELQSQQKRAKKRTDVDPARLQKLATEIAAAQKQRSLVDAGIDQLTDIPLRSAKAAVARALPRLRKPSPRLPIRKIEDFYIGHGGVRARYYVDAQDQRVGAYVRFFKSGKVKQRFEYAGGVRWGAAVHYYASGKKKLVTRYENGLEHGERVEYDTTGKVKQRTQFVHGERQD